MLKAAEEDGLNTFQGETATRPWEALVVGEWDESALAVSHLLWRAGFEVDFISTSLWVRLGRFVRSARIMAPEQDLAAAALGQMAGRTKPYDWVIAADDRTLRRMGSYPWPAELRPRLLPVVEAGHANHLFSKVGLSRGFAAGGVQTPPFHVAASAGEAQEWANEHGYPVFLKVDSSGGGYGVYECACADEIGMQEALFASPPVLVQKKIDGVEVDLSAIFLDHELVHFSYARIEKAMRRFGPSVLRTYFPLPLVDERIFDELARLGHALGADGFSNITCIEAADGSGRYYFEADLRPNVWVDYSKYIGEDPAERVRAWFARGTCLSAQSLKRQETCLPVTMPYFLRMKFRDVLMNRYGVWKTLPFAEPVMILERCVPPWRLRRAEAALPDGLRRRLRSLLAGQRA